MVKFDTAPPFTNFDNMYKTIDLTPHGDTLWENVAKDPPSNQSPAVWNTEYNSWFYDQCKLICNITSIHAFNKKFNYNGQHCFHDAFSDNWCW